MPVAATYRARAHLMTYGRVMRHMHDAVLRLTDVRGVRASNNRNFTAATTNGRMLRVEDFIKPLNAAHKYTRTHVNLHASKSDFDGRR